MPTFEEELQEAALDGITFPVSSRRVAGGRAYGRHRYAYRDGQAGENTGLEPVVIEIEAPIFNGVEWPTELWPATWDALRLLLEDTESSGHFEFDDPEFGPIQCIVPDWSWETTADERDGGRLRLTIERAELDEGTLAMRDSDAQGTSARLATQLDSALIDAGLDGDDIATTLEAYGVPLADTDPVDLSAGNVFASLVTDFTGALDEGALMQDEVAARLDEIRSRIDAVRSLPETQSPRNWSLLYSAERLIASVTDVAEAARRTAPPIGDYYVRDMMSIYEISAELYRTSLRAEEILTRNVVPDPLFIPRGTVLRVVRED
ncbi:MAG: DNA circularization N-terminal domain-containing protein [Deltaproteobacteria bacterium]|nr:DNA circularization N-terminal domain-containing protein [Deltaproteobacteria bacterium]